MSRLAALRFTLKSFIIKGVIGEMAKKLIPNEKFRSNVSPPMTNR